MSMDSLHKELLTFHRATEAEVSRQWKTAAEFLIDGIAQESQRFFSRQQEILELDDAAVCALFNPLFERIQCDITGGERVIGDYWQRRMDCTEHELATWHRYRELNAGANQILHHYRRLLRCHSRAGTRLPQEAALAAVGTVLDLGPVDTATLSAAAEVLQDLARYHPLPPHMARKLSMQISALSAAPPSGVHQSRVKDALGHNGPPHSLDLGSA